MITESVRTADTSALDIYSDLVVRIPDPSAKLMPVIESATALAVCLERLVRRVEAVGLVERDAEIFCALSQRLIRMLWLIGPEEVRGSIAEGIAGLSGAIADQMLAARPVEGSA